VKIDGILVAKDGTIGRNVFFERIRRITGYLVGDVRGRFNNGKRAEERDRVKHFSFLAWENRKAGWGADWKGESQDGPAYPDTWPWLKDGGSLSETIDALRIRDGSFPQKECELSLHLRRETGKAGNGEGSPAPKEARA